MKRFCLLLLASTVLACAVRADDGDAAEIRRNGLLAYVERVASHPGIRSAVNEEAKADIRRKFGRFEGRKPDHVTSRVVRTTTASVEIRMAFVQYEDSAFMVMVTGARRGEKLHPFGLSVSSMNEIPSLVGDLLLLYKFLPRHELDADLVTAMGAALRDSIVAKDYAIYDSFVQDLATKAEPLPTFARGQMEVSRNFVPRANVMLKEYQFQPDVTYLGARSMTEDFFIASFTAETKLGPAVIISFFFMNEGIPVLVPGQLELGRNALMFLPDMQKPRKIPGADK